jgi:hypothetical protein
MLKKQTEIYLGEKGFALSLTRRVDDFTDENWVGDLE